MSERIIPQLLDKAYLMFQLVTAIIIEGREMPALPKYFNLQCRIFLEVDISGSVGFEVIQFNARVCGRTSFDDCGQHMFSLVAILNSNIKYPPSGYLAVESSYVSRGTQAGIFHCSRDVVNDYHWSYSPVSSI